MTKTADDAAPDPSEDPSEESVGVEVGREVVVGSTTVEGRRVVVVVGIVGVDDGPM